MLEPAVCQNRNVHPETRQGSGQILLARQDFEAYFCVLMVCLPGSVILDPVASRFQVSGLKQIMYKLGHRFSSGILNLFFFLLNENAKKF